MVTHIPVVVLTTFWQRLKGIKRFRGSLKNVYLPRCKAVHTFGMRSDLHLLWLSKTGRLVALQKNVKPNCIKQCQAAFGVVEVPATLDIPNYPVGHQFRLKGQALVEAAFVMPILFLLLFGFIELGLVLHTQQQLTYVSQNATQVGSLTNNDLKITGTVESFYDPSEVQVAVTNTSTLNKALITSANRRYNDLLSVQLARPYQLHIPFWPVEVFNLTAQSSARVLCQSNNPPYQCD